MVKGNTLEVGKKRAIDGQGYADNSGVFTDEKVMAYGIRKLFYQNAPNLWSLAEEKASFDDKVSPKILPIYKINPHMFLQAIARDTADFPDETILYMIINRDMSKSTEIILDLLLASKQLQYSNPSEKEKAGENLKTIVNHKVRGMTYLHMMNLHICRLMPKIFKLDIDPASVNKEGETALHDAVRGWSFLACKYLVEGGCPIDAQDDGGMTALSIAIKFSNYRFVDYLRSAGSDPSIKDLEGNNCFHLLAISGNISCDLWKNFDYSVENNQRKTPVDLARETVKSIEIQLKKNNQLSKWDLELNKRKYLNLKKIIEIGESQAQSFREKIQDTDIIPKKPRTTSLRSRKPIIFDINL